MILAEIRLVILELRSPNSRLDAPSNELSKSFAGVKFPRSRPGSSVGRATDF